MIVLRTLPAARQKFECRNQSFKQFQVAFYLHSQNAVHPQYIDNTSNVLVTISNTIELNNSFSLVQKFFIAPAPACLRQKPTRIPSIHYAKLQNLLPKTGHCE